MFLVVRSQEQFHVRRDGIAGACGFHDPQTGAIKQQRNSAGAEPARRRRRACQRERLERADAGCEARLQGLLACAVVPAGGKRASRCCQASAPGA